MSVIGCKWTMPDAYESEIVEKTLCINCPHKYNSELCKTVRDQLGMSLIHEGE